MPSTLIIRFVRLWITLRCPVVTQELQLTSPLSPLSSLKCDDMPGVCLRADGTTLHSSSTTLIFAAFLQPTYERATDQLVLLLAFIIFFLSFIRSSCALNDVFAFVTLSYLLSSKLCQMLSFEIYTWTSKGWNEMPY
jgi:hypothetical protein